MSDGDHGSDTLIEIPEEDNSGANRASQDSDGRGSVHDSIADDGDLDDLGDIGQQDSFHDSQSAKDLQQTEKSGPLADLFDKKNSHVPSANISKASVRKEERGTEYHGSNEDERSEEGDESLDEDEEMSQKLLEDDDDYTIVWSTLDSKNNSDDDIDEEEDEGVALDAYRERKKLYRFTKYKQERLMVKYMQCIEKLKVFRKKNLYLQDKIFKHVQEKEKILKECREAVLVRKEKARLQEQDEIGSKPLRKLSQDLAETEVAPCESSQSQSYSISKPEDPFSKKDVESDMSEKEGQGPNSFDSRMSKGEMRRSKERKCQRLIREITGKGPSKLPRLSMKHYHFEKIREDQKEYNECDENEALYSEQPSNQPQPEESGDIESTRRSIQYQEVDQENLNVLEIGTHKIHKRKGSNMNEEDDNDQEWREEHEKRRSKSLESRRYHRASKSHPETLNADPSARGQSRQSTDNDGKRKTNTPRSQLADSSRGKSKIFGHQDGNDISSDDENSKSLKTKHRCAEKMRKRKSAINRELMAVQKVQEDLVNVDNPEHEEEEDFALPEFKYELSDISLTKMSYGTKLRQEMEKTLIDSKFNIPIKWPLAVKGFAEYFQRQNPYGKVIYTFRHHSQIKNAKKITSKYRYLLHNYNYQVQQYDVLNEVHDRNMIYLRSSQAKWEALERDLFSRFIVEIRNASDNSVDSGGSRMSRGKVDRWCADFGKMFEKLKKTVGCFFRVLTKVNMDIRDLCYSESHGEGVELFEFKHLLRTKETITAQHFQKQETMKGYIKRCQKFTQSYRKLLDHKTDAEKSVTESFIESGEISCALFPKMIAVKAYEATAKQIQKIEADLKMKSGIVPFKHLVSDYEHTFVSIGSKRQVRRDLQLKFNQRVREVHELFDNMEEIQRKMPELFREPDSTKINEILDSCGQRPNTAPPSFSRSRRPSSASIPQFSSKAKKSIFFTQAQTREMLEGSVTRPKTALGFFRESLPASKSKSIISFSQGSKSSDAQIPRASTSFTYLPVTQSTIKIQKAAGLERAQDRRKSLFIKGNEDRPSRIGLNLEERMNTEQRFASLDSNASMKRRMTTLIASEEAKSTAFAKAKAVSRMIPTAAKTGIVPKITRENMLNITKVHKEEDSKKKGKSHHHSSYVPPVARNLNSINPYELETKRWPYHYYIKRSPQLETSSKRSMKLGNQITNMSSRPMTANL